MSSYRDGAPPAAAEIKLETHDQQKLLTAMALLIVVVLVLGTGGMMIVQRMTPRSALLPAMIGISMLIGIGFVGGLFVVIKKLRELRFLLEVSEGGIRLLGPSGAALADTASRTLAFTRVTYTRRGRHGSAWTRPGWQMRHPGGNHLIGALLPELPWEGVAHDPRMPEFELRPPQFELLDDRLKRG